MPAYEFCRGFCTLVLFLWRHKKSLKLAKTLSAKTLKLVLAINSNLKVYRVNVGHRSVPLWRGGGGGGGGGGYHQASAGILAGYEH